MDPPWSVTRPVGELRPGDHGWLPYANGEEQRHVVGSFVGDGLAWGHKVIFLAGEDVPAPAPPPGPDRGLLTVLPVDRARGPGGHVDARSVMEALAKEITRAEEQGHTTIRVTADMTWAVRRPAGLEQLLRCERHIERAIGPSTSVAAICQFDRRRCGPGELAALAGTHAVRVLPDPEFADPVLEIVRTFQPCGLALRGELDAFRHRVLDEALAQLLPVSQGREVHLDLAELAFIDLGALNMLADLVRTGRGPLVLDRMRPRLVAVVETVGWHRLPGLRLGG
ncbi:MEDS domain-containing protein [Actinomadura hibisca]|uniref:MEDS domain-containing protein n=1 Tax=Actinomadura hibisca TaxID=68565 RepID=UPI00082CAC66|nr:MEDS domain-containing protein [Actinomadura hibisca]